MAVDSILLALSETGEMTYQQIVDLGIRRQNARKMLDNLIRRRLVHEEGRENWKHGKKLFYSLTEKGKEELICTALNTVNESLKIVRELCTGILSDLPRLEQWKKTARERFFALSTESKDMPLDQKLQERNKIYAPLIKSLRLLHEIYVHAVTLNPQSLGDVFIRVTKKGRVKMIEEAELKKEAPVFYQTVADKIREEYQIDEERLPEYYGL